MISCGYWNTHERRNILQFFLGDKYLLSIYEKVQNIYVKQIRKFVEREKQLSHKQHICKWDYNVNVWSLEHANLFDAMLWHLLFVKTFPPHAISLVRLDISLNESALNGTWRSTSNIQNVLCEVEFHRCDNDVEFEFH